MRNLLEIVASTEVSEEPWKHLHLRSIELPTINWYGKTRRVFNRRFDLLDRVPGVQGILTGQPLLHLLDEKFGPLEFDEHLTYYFVATDTTWFAFNLLLMGPVNLGLGWLLVRAWKRVGGEPIV